MVRRSRRTRRNKGKRRRSVCKQRGGNNQGMYVGASLEFELPGRFPQTLDENQIEDIKMKIGQYFADSKVPFTYYGTENQYHVFTTLGSKSAYFNLNGGSMEPTAGVFVDIEISLDSIAPIILTSKDISDLKAKIRYIVKDSAQYLIYKGLFSNMHVFITDHNVIHGRVF